VQNVPASLALAVALAIYLTLDTAIIVRTGRAPGRFRQFLRYCQMHGPVSRARGPQRYWAYVFGNVADLTQCVVYVAWFISSPQTFRSAPDLRPP
jgi:hypothetical protein